MLCVSEHLCTRVNNIFQITINLMTVVLVIIIVLLIPSNTTRSFTLVSDYLDPCTESDECTDHRFVCLPDENGTRRCVCDRFHQWGGESEGCIQVYNFHQILDRTVNQNHEADKLEKQEKRIFTRHIVAVYFVIGIFAVAVLIVIGYCQHIRRKDGRFKQRPFSSMAKMDPEYLPARADV